MMAWLLSRMIIDIGWMLTLLLVIPIVDILLFIDLTAMIISIDYYCVFGYFLLWYNYYYW